MTTDLSATPPTHVWVTQAMPRPVAGTDLVDLAVATCALCGEMRSAVVLAGSDHPGDIDLSGTCPAEQTPHGPRAHPR